MGCDAKNNKMTQTHMWWRRTWWSQQYMSVMLLVVEEDLSYNNTNIMFVMHIYNTEERLSGCTEDLFWWYDNEGRSSVLQ